MVTFPFTPVGGDLSRLERSLLYVANLTALDIKDVPGQVFDDLGSVARDLMDYAVDKLSLYRND